MKFTDAEIKYLNEYTENYDSSVRVYEGYSGRGMYGTETDGLVVSDPISLVGLVRHICEDREYLEEEPEENVDVETFLDKIEGLTRRDNLGYDIIMY